MATAVDSPVSQERHCRADELHLAFEADEGSAGEHAQRSGPEMKADWTLITPPLLKGWVIRALLGWQMSVMKLWAKNSRGKRKSCTGIRFVLPWNANLLNGGSLVFASQSSWAHWPRLLWTFAGHSPGKRCRARRMRRPARRIAGISRPGSVSDLVETSGRVSVRSFCRRVLSVGALEKSEIWGVAIKNSFPQADGFQRKAPLRGPAEWGPSGTNRIWKLLAPEVGKNGALVALQKTPERFLLRAEDSPARADLKFRVSPSFFVVVGAQRAASPPELMTFLAAKRQTMY